MIVYLTYDNCILFIKKQSYKPIIAHNVETQLTILVKSHKATPI